MKRFAIVLMLSLAMMGCKKTVSAPVPGELNTFDAYVYRVLLDSQAAINSFKSSPSAQNSSIKPILNQVISDYDIVEAAYQTWRAVGGTGSTAPITAGITKLNTDLGSLQAGIAGGH